MRVFITYPNRAGYDHALRLLTDCWGARWGGAAIETAYSLIVIFAPKKVIL